MHQLRFKNKIVDETADEYVNEKSNEHADKMTDEKSDKHAILLTDVLNYVLSSATKTS